MKECRLCLRGILICASFYCWNSRPKKTRFRTEFSFSKSPQDIDRGCWVQSAFHHGCSHTQSGTCNTSTNSNTIKMKRVYIWNIKHMIFVVVSFRFWRKIHFIFKSHQSPLMALIWTSTVGTCSIRISISISTDLLDLGKITSWQREWVKVL